MALGPNSELTPELVTQLQELEQLIDRTIDRHYSSKEVGVELGRKAGKFLLREKLSQKYHEAGWKNVEFIIRRGGSIRMVLSDPTKEERT